jgi:hypothetical protein
MYNVSNGEVDIKIVVSVRPFIVFAFYLLYLLKDFLSHLAQMVTVEGDVQNL